MTAPTLPTARERFEQGHWADAYSLFQAADGEAGLGAEDLETTAIAAYLIGLDDDSDRIWERAHHEFERAGDEPRAARCAIWIGLGLFDRGEMARGSGWLARAHRLIEEGRHDCVEQGYLLLPKAIQEVEGGDAAAGYATFSQLAKIGRRFADIDLVTLGRLGCGSALTHLGELDEGVTLLDEAMLAVTAGEVSPMVVGVAYCIMIQSCHEIFDVRRAREWTTALSRWCEAHPDLVPFRGQCLVHRAELLQMEGRWPEALREAVQAGEMLSQPVVRPAAGDAFYQQAELRRLGGELELAEQAYERASRHGRSPQPGLARLRLAQGRLDDAHASIRRVAGEAEGPVARAAVLSAYVEIALAADAVVEARTAADELSEIAADMKAAFLVAVSDHCRGAVLLAEGDLAGACDHLRRASSAWRTLGVPYEEARARELVGVACGKLGDRDAARLDRDAACERYSTLGALPDVERLERFAVDGSPAPGGLTDRELEILALVSTGATNRVIAGELFLSEKTVARHVSNIFTKLGLSSRSAATAYAYRHGLV